MNGYESSAGEFNTENLADGMLYVFTDGSCSYKDSTGGWGWVAYRDGAILSRGYGYSKTPTTVNRMELTAILKALQFIKTTDCGHAQIVTDSMYCLNAVTRWHMKWEFNGWLTDAGNPVTNKDLIKKIIDFDMRRACQVSVWWVKGHSGVELNEVADRLASLGRKRAVYRLNK